MSSEPSAIEVTGLSKCYTLYDQPSDRLKQFVLPRLQRLAGRAPHSYYREFWALQDVSLTIGCGETVGIVGRNGAGKSTLLQVICGTLTPTAGDVRVSGRVAALLELGSGFNPEFTGIENVKTYAAVLGLAPSDVEARLDDILAFADIGAFVHQPVKTYSSGMMVRLAFAVASAVDPDILIVDEALSVGDLAFQNKCLRRIENFIEAGGTTLFVSHSPAQVVAFCNRAYWLHEGKVREAGDAKSVVNSYVNFMRDGYARAPEVVAEAKPVAASPTWTVIGPAHDVDARSGHAITAFSFSSAQTDAPLTALFDLPVRVRLRLRIRTSGIDRPLVGVGLFGALNLPIVHFNSMAVGIDLQPLGPGTHELAIEFQLPVIADGEYVLHLGLDDGEPGASTMLCHVRAALTLLIACRKRARHRQYGVVPVDESTVSIDLSSTAHA
jgi:lipopolysaccharide transport system ATP-binding protein